MASVAEWLGIKPKTCKTLFCENMGSIPIREDISMSLQGPFINDVTQKTTFLNPLHPSVTKFSYKKRIVKPGLSNHM